VTIKVLCEGKTEEGLRPLLENAVGVKGCGLHIKAYDGVTKLLGKLDSTVREELNCGAKFVFCLVDYYHFPLPEKQRTLPRNKRVVAIQNFVTEKLDESYRSALRCYVVLHEVEAWILADEKVVAQRLRTKTLPSWQQPETINGMNPPAKELEKLFRTKLKKPYDKYKDGGDLLKRVDWQKVYAKCPTFKKLVDELRSLCQQQ